MKNALILSFLAAIAFSPLHASHHLKHTVTIEETDNDRLRVQIDGELFTEIHLKGFSRPILYPIMNAAGKGMTRDWPVIKNGREGEVKNHPHHQGIFIGHQGQNGISFWHIGKGRGTVEHVRIIKKSSSKGKAMVRTFNHWKGPDGKIMCTDTRELSFGVVNGARYIDIELNMHASHGDLNFEEYKDGFVGIRTHPHLRLVAHPKKGGMDTVYGHAENSEGVTGEAIWAKRADWVHYWGKLEGTDAGVAMLAHPKNFRSPTFWHAREYGLCSANPFGRIFEGGHGEYLLKSGETLTLRYRFLFHDTTKDKANIAKQFKVYSSSKL